MYEYNAHVIRVVDGDTLHVRLDLGLDIYTDVTLRLAGVNTPEMSTPDGAAAKEFTRQWLFDQCDSPSTIPIPIKVRTIKDRREKYGRYLAVIWPYDNISTSENMTTLGSLNYNLIAQGWTYKAKS